MNLRLILFVVGAGFISTTAVAQITVGRLYPQTILLASGLTPLSSVDVLHPASGSGTLVRAVVRWAFGSGCQNAFKLKFLRPTDTVGVYSAVTERGPFPASEGANEILLDPPVKVLAGDLIGITQLVLSDKCGGVQHAVVPDRVSLIGNTELSAGPMPNAIKPNYGLTPDIFATSKLGNVVVSMIPVAGATPGLRGSFFRTSLQLTGTDVTPISGTIVYHPAGRPAAPGDPSMNFTVNGGLTISLPDIAASLGQTGIGTIDILTSGDPPKAIARVFNDLGAGGTVGFTEEGVAPTSLPALQRFMFHMPTDVKNFRMNIGVRALDEVRIFMTKASAGEFLGTYTRVYPADSFEQMSVEAFAQMPSMVSDGALFFLVSGRAIVYATITDNRTNSSSIEFPTYP